MLHRRTSDKVMLRTNTLSYTDGTHSIEDMAALFTEETGVVTEMVRELVGVGLLLSELQRSPASFP